MRVLPTGWLDGARHWPSARTTGLVPGGPLGACWHWTGGGDPDALSRRIRALPPPPGATSAERARASKAGIEPSASSWHLLIGRDGIVRQSAALNVGTWHVGKRGRIGGRELIVNQALVGIELDNLGELERDGAGWRAGDYRVDGGRAVEHVAGRVFDAFTAAQEQAAVEVVRALAERFGWGRLQLGYGHCDFDAPRKQDPGPVWRGTVLPRVLTAAGVTR